MTDHDLDDDIARLIAKRRFRNRVDAWAYWGPNSPTGQYLTTVKASDYPDNASYQRAYYHARKAMGKPVDAGRKRDRRKVKVAA